METAFLGLGKMGRLMAGRLLQQDGPGRPDRLRVWNRTPGRAGELVAQGAVEAGTPREAADGADVLVTMLFDGDAVRSALLEGADAAVHGLREGALVVDSSTTGPAVARELAAALGERGVRFVDAPVAGSTPVAEKGELGVLLGGAEDDVAEARRVVGAWGAPEKTRHAGPVGSGQALKLVINLSLGVAAAGIGECLRLAADLGADTGAALDVLATGPFGWTLGQKRPYLERPSDGVRTYEPATFALDALAKDLRLVRDAATSDLPVAAQVLAEAERAEAAGWGHADHAALIGLLAFGDEPRG